MRIDHHASTFTPGASLQYTATAIDQFDHPMRGDPAVTYSILLGDGTIDTAGLFIAGQTAGHVKIEMSVDGLTGTVAPRLNEPPRA